MNDSTHDCSSYFTAMFCFLAGGVAGASMALLLAPRSGKATRDLLQRKVSDTAASARDVKDELIRRGEKIRDEAIHRVDDAASALAGDGQAKLRGKGVTVTSA